MPQYKDPRPPAYPSPHPRDERHPLGIGRRGARRLLVSKNTRPVDCSTSDVGLHPVPQCEASTLCMPEDPDANNMSPMSPITPSPRVFSASGGRCIGVGNSRQNDTDSPDSSEVFMALEMKTNGLVGCAHFDTSTGTLYLQEDTRLAGFELVESLIFQARPTSIIVPASAPENFLDYLKRQAQEYSSSGLSDGEAYGFSVHTVSSSNFSVDAAKKMLSLHCGTESQAQSCSAMFTTAVEEARTYSHDGDVEESAVFRHKERNSMMQLGACINLDNKVTLGCAGALLCDLERKNAAMLFPDPTTTRIRSVQTRTYDDCMFASADTLLALQIFHSDPHQDSVRPAPDKVGCASRNSRSIFGLFHSLALTSQGRIKLREIFTLPSTKIDVIRARHDCVSSILDPSNQTLVSATRSALKNIKDLRPLLKQLRRGLLLPGNFASIKQSAWSHIHVFCLNVLHIMSLVSDVHGGECKIIGDALSCVSRDSLARVRDALMGQIDFAESAASGRSVVATGVSDELDALKAEYETLQTDLGNTCDGYRSGLPDHLQGDVVGCIFHPQLGYLLVATDSLRTQLAAASSGHTLRGRPTYEEWEELFQEDSLAYYKTPELGRIGTQYGDLAGQIIELEIRIFHALGSAVLAEEDELVRASDAVGNIDSMFALASGAEIFHLARPQMTSSNVLHIERGRHLLQETGATNFVPNDCRLAGGSGTGPNELQDDSFEFHGALRDAPSAIVVTGPNHSGKSVYIKQVAAIVFLAHIGSYVPADVAIVGITDKILTRIATRESVSRDESAFGVDLRQAAFSINFATRRSLVLVDEFGKGTATNDGAALFDALLTHFLELGPSAPKVLAATHFHEIFDSGSFASHPGLGLCYMNVSIDPDASRPEEKVKFLHTLKEGRSSESFGCSCAAMNGVASPVVERASRITRLLEQGTSLEKIYLGSHNNDVLRSLQKKEERVRLFLLKMGEVLDSGSAWQARDILHQIFAYDDAVQSC